MGAFLSPQPNHGGEVAEVNNAMQRFTKIKSVYVHPYHTHIHEYKYTCTHTHFRILQGPSRGDCWTATGAAQLPWGTAARKPAAHAGNLWACCVCSRWVQQQQQQQQLSLNHIASSALTLHLIHLASACRLHAELLCCCQAHCRVACVDEPH
jgi:hypothetical protein